MYCFSTALVCIFRATAHRETTLSRFSQQHMNSVCCRWVYIMCFWNESVDVSCCLLCVWFSFCSNTSLRALDALNSCCPRRWEPHNQLVDKNTEEKQRALSCSSHSTHQCLSTTANRNHVFRSTFYTATPARGNLVSLSLFFFFSLNRNTVVRATCLFCAIKGLLQMSNQNEGLLGAFTHTSNSDTSSGTVYQYLSIFTLVKCTRAATTDYWIVNYNQL